jgi:hypothetical protein
MFGQQIEKVNFSADFSSNCLLIVKIDLEKGLHLNEEAPNSFKLISSQGIQTNDKTSGTLENEIKFNFTPQSETTIT